MSEEKFESVRELSDICYWYGQGSTNRKTMESESPLYCQLHQCDGYNKDCQMYAPKTPIEETKNE